MGTAVRRRERVHFPAVDIRRRLFFIAAIFTAIVSARYSWRWRVWCGQFLLRCWRRIFFVAIFTRTDGNRQAEACPT
jgi:hypothetical protein